MAKLGLLHMASHLRLALPGPSKVPANRFRICLFRLLRGHLVLPDSVQDFLMRLHGYILIREIVPFLPAGVILDNRIIDHRRGMKVADHFRLPFSSKSDA